MSPVGIGFFPLGIVVLTFLVIGAIVLISKHGMRGLLAVGGILLGLFVLLFGFRFARVRHPEARYDHAIPSAPDVTMQARSSNVIYHTSADLPTIWLDGLEQQYFADVYPTLSSATQALARQAADLLTQIIPDQKEPKEIQLFRRPGQDNLPDEILQVMADHLRRAADGIKVSITASPPVTNQDGAEVSVVNPAADSETVQIQLDIPVFRQESNHSRSNAPLTLKSGTLSFSLSGPSDRISRQVEFVEKPWVDNWADFINLNPNNHWVLAYSQHSTTNEQDARRQATSQACQQIARLIHDRRIVPQNAGFSVNPDDLYQQDFVVDRFAQSFQGAAGPIWREVLLLDASPDRLNRLGRGISFTVSRHRSSRIRMVFSLGAMLALITVVYLFLNAATKGYYTWSLRVVLILLAAAGVFLVLTLA